MYHNVYFQGVKRRPVNQQQNNNYVETPIARPQHPQFKEISPAVNDAICAYASPIIRKPYEKMSFNECIASLKKQGYIEGLNFEIHDNRLVQIKNTHGNVIKCLGYDDPNDKNPFVQDLLYDNKNREIRLICKENNKIKFQVDTYYNDEIPQEQFTKDGITAYTKPDEYIEYLKNNNIKFKVEPKIYGDNQETIEITEYDDRNRKSQFTGFELNGENRVMRELYGFDGSRERLEFDKNATYITQYFN